MIRPVVERVPICRARIAVGVNAKIRPRFRPDVIGFGRVHAVAGIIVRRCIGHLRRIRISGGDQAVNERRCRIAEDLLRLFLARWLGEVVVLHRNHKNIAHRLRVRVRCCEKNACGRCGKQRSPGLQTADFSDAVSSVCVRQRTDKRLVFHINCRSDFMPEEWSYHSITRRWVQSK